MLLKTYSQRLGVGSQSVQLGALRARQTARTAHLTTF